MAFLLVAGERSVSETGFAAFRGKRGREPSAIQRMLTRRTRMTPPRSPRPHPICRKPSKRSLAQPWPHWRHGGSSLTSLILPDRSRLQLLGARAASPCCRSKLSAGKLTSWPRRTLSAHRKKSFWAMHTYQAADRHARFVSPVTYPFLCGPMKFSQRGGKLQSPEAATQYDLQHPRGGAPSHNPALTAGVASRCTRLRMLGIRHRKPARLTRVRFPGRHDQRLDDRAIAGGK